MRYLVTGGAGFIGSNVARALAADGHGVTVLDDFSSGSAENFERVAAAGEADLVEGSILDRELVRGLVASSDRCFHLASAVGVRLIVERTLESLDVNAGGSEVVIDACAEHGRRLLYSSSSEVYGKDSAGALAEDADRVMGPTAVARWSYALAKALGEARIHAHAANGGIEATIVRFFNVVGPGQSAAYGMVLPRFVGQARAGEPLTVYGDGTQTRCFVHVADAVAGLRALMDCDAAVGGTFNLGSREEVAIEELARRVLAATGSSSPIEHIPPERVYGEGFEEPGRRKPDLGAIREAVGWEPELDLSAIIADTIAAQGEPGETPLDGAVRVH